jgi:hypothetical protein
LQIKQGRFESLLSGMNSLLLNILEEIGCN